MKENIYILVGVISEIYPEYMAGYSERLVGLYICALKTEVSITSLRLLLGKCLFFHPRRRYRKTALNACIQLNCTKLWCKHFSSFSLWFFSFLYCQHGGMQKFWSFLPNCNKTKIFKKIILVSSSHSVQHYGDRIRDNFW